MDENQKTSTSTEINIALLQKDVGNILKSVEKIDLRMEVYEKTFARKEELVTIEKTIQIQYIEIKKELEKKVDHTDFDPIKKTLSRINWLIIVTVIVALLSLVIKAGGA